MNRPDRAYGRKLVTDHPGRDDRALAQIRDLPEATFGNERELESVPDFANDPVTLMERSCGGWSVELRLIHDGRVEIVAQRGEDAPLETVFVALDKALDAFNHPYCYLPAA